MTQNQPIAKLLTQVSDIIEETDASWICLEKPFVIYEYLKNDPLVPVIALRPYMVESDTDNFQINTSSVIVAVGANKMFTEYYKKKVSVETIISEEDNDFDVDQFSVQPSTGTLQ